MVRQAEDMEQNIYADAYLMLLERHPRGTVIGDAVRDAGFEMGAHPSIRA